MSEYKLHVISWLPVYQRGLLVPIPGQFMWDLQRREQHRGRFSSKYFDFPCECHSIHLPQTPYITLATDSVVTQNTDYVLEDEYSIP